MFLMVMSLRLPKDAHERAGHHLSRSTSRGGLLGLMQKLTRISGRASAAAVMIAITAVIALSLFWLGPDSVINRITKEGASAEQQSSARFSNREWVWEDTFRMIGANPILGVGLGAYQTAFSTYTESDGSLKVPQAHNDYLQIVADCGIIGGVIAVWFLVIIFRAMGRATKSRDPLLAGLGLGASGAVFSMLVHSLFDFNLQLPSNALLFLVMTAVVARVAQTVDEPEEAMVAARRSEVKAEMAMSAKRAASEVSR
jgi:O-antigen ligase